MSSPPRLIRGLLLFCAVWADEQLQTTLTLDPGLKLWGYFAAPLQTRPMTVNEKGYESSRSFESCRFCILQIGRSTRCLLATSHPEAPALYKVFP